MRDPERQKKPTHRIQRARAQTGHVGADDRCGEEGQCFERVDVGPLGALEARVDVWGHGFLERALVEGGARVGVVEAAAVGGEEDAGVGLGEEGEDVEGWDGVDGVVGGWGGHFRGGGLGIGVGGGKGCRDFGSVGRFWADGFFETRSDTP